MLKHTGELPHGCNLCTRRFRTHNSMKRHIENFHLKMRPFQCLECNKTFFWKRHLNRHMGIHERERNGNDQVKRNVKIKTEFEVECA